MIKKILGILVVMLLILMMIPISVSSDATFGKTIYVDDGGGADYTKIQDAIDAASDDDTIYVYGGIYHENLVVDKSLNLVGEDLFDSIIDGGEKGNVINISADSVKISGFTIKNSHKWSYGIFVEGSNNNLISDNIISENHYGIKLDHSDENIISNNEFFSNAIGITIFGGDDNIITDNIISQTIGSGIYLRYHGSNNSISRNTIYSTGWSGIDLTGNYPVIVADNTFFNCGLDVYYEPAKNIVSNNTVNGKPLVYLYGKSDLNIGNAGQIILVNCENITIKNQEISGTSTAIQLVETHHCTIDDNQILNSYNGIYLASSEDNQIINNTIKAIKDEGIALYDHSNKNMITENTIRETGRGVYFAYKCNNNIISRNDVSDNKYAGINLGSYCHNNIISGNFLYGNKYGIDICWFANHTTVIRNAIGCNEWYGIHVKDSSNNNISQNNFHSNGKHAFFIDAFDNNWDGNYWSGGKFKFLPKLIFGRMSINYEGPFDDDWPWIPWINFDYRPARKPYDIP
jgi:parallel beta-helix repeat protein